MNNIKTTPPNNTTDTDYRSNGVPKPKSFSSVVQTENFPKKDQAIIFPLLPGCDASYYAEKMALKIGTANILHCGVISEKRVRMYLKTKEIAQNFLETDGSLEIDRKKVFARPYVTNNKKIIISNVPPHVPHNIVLNLITSLGAVPATGIKFLHLTMKENLRSILSERRSIFITEQTANKLPTSATIEYEDDQYRIFFNDAIVKCFICHQTGHNTKQCTYNYDNAEQTENEKSDDVLDLTINEPKETMEEDILTPENEAAATSQTNDENTQVIITDVTDNLASENKKRPLSLDGSSSSSYQPSLDNIHENLPSQPAKKLTGPEKKKPKTDDDEEKNIPTSIKELLKSMEDNFNQNKDKYPISFANFGVLLEMVKSHKEPIPTVMEFTNDLHGIINIIEENYKFLTTRTMKTRFTKLKNKIKNHLNLKNNDDGSGSESNSDEFQSL